MISFGILHQRLLLRGSARKFSNVSKVNASSIRVNMFHAGVFLNPHPAKVQKGGEDAASVTDNFIAVADGVGGWANSGVDPAVFSRELCTNIDKLV